MAQKLAILLPFGKKRDKLPRADCPRLLVSSVSASKDFGCGCLAIIAAPQHFSWKIDLLGYKSGAVGPCQSRSGCWLYIQQSSFIFATSLADPPSKLLRDAAGTQIPPFVASLGLSLKERQDPWIILVWPYLPKLWKLYISKSLNSKIPNHAKDFIYSESFTSQISNSLWL